MFASLLFFGDSFFSKTAANNSANAVVMPFYTFFDLYITGCFETVQLGSSFFYWGGSRGQCLLTCCKMLHRARPISANGTSKTARTGTLGQPHGTMDQSSWCVTSFGFSGHRKPPQDQAKAKGGGQGQTPNNFAWKPSTPDLFPGVIRMVRNASGFLMVYGLWMFMEGLPLQPLLCMRTSRACLSSWPLASGATLWKPRTLESDAWLDEYKRTSINHAWSRCNHQI